MGSLAPRMPEAKRPRGTSGGSKSRSTSSRSTGSRSTASRARGTASGSSGAKRPAAPRKPAARKPAPRKPAVRGEELEPLDLEGTDFEELLDASAAPRGRRMKPGDPEVTVAFEDDLEAELDEIPEEEADPFASIRPRIAGREREQATTASNFTTTGANDPITPLSERFGGGGRVESAMEPIAPWSGIEDDVALDDEEAKPTDELLVAVLGLALAGVTALLPWYETGFTKLSGLAAGKLGVLTFIGGFGAFLIVLLRRLKVTVRFPLQTGVIIEGLAYLAIAGALLSRFGPFLPDGASVINVGTLVPVGIGIALAFTAARLTSGAPLMVQPGWIRAQGGRLGAALLVLFIVGAGALAAVKPGAPKAASPTGAGIEYFQTAPACLTDEKFPILGKVTPKPGTGYFSTPDPTGGGQALLCGGTLQSEARIWTLKKNYVDALAAAGWTASVTPQQQASKGQATIGVTAPLCGSIHLLDTAGNPEGANTDVTIALQPCRQQPDN